jgi:hypothetical protein
MTQETESERVYQIEVSAKIEVRGGEYPDDKAQSFLDKIKTKIHCNRETMTMLGSRVEAYEVYDAED